MTEGKCGLCLVRVIMAFGLNVIRGPAWQGDEHGSSPGLFSGESSQRCLIIPLPDLLFLSRCKNTPVQDIMNPEATLFPQQVHFLTQ